jgi:uncharacterized protein (TIGR00661 family)
MKNKNILICPLEWGLGHAARMIPVARKLRLRGNNIFIGAGGEHMALLRTEIPEATFISFAGFSPGYSKHLPSYLVMLFKIPLLTWHVIREHRKLKQIISEYNIDVVISDNRFGLWNKRITSIYFTHMIRIPFPRPFRFLEFSGVLIHRFFMSRYDACFIPDLPGENNVSGRISHNVRLPRNARYAGLLSRFSGISPAETCRVGQKHNTVILSGPEPQRGILKEKLEERFRDQEPVTVILGGKPSDGSEMIQDGNLIYFSHLAAADMAAMIISSEAVITRSGYTTVMELIGFDVSALLIPTPGQTEQEYLAGYLEKRGWFKASSQKHCADADLATRKAACNGRMMMEESERLLDEALDSLSED